MKNLPKLYIKAHQEIRAVQGHPWVYSNEIANFAELKTLPNGALVEVYIPKHQEPFALAYFNAHQLIAARILTYNLREKIDLEFFENRFLQAQNLRKKFFDKPFYRLIHSEADGLAGLVVDRFDDVFVCQITTAGMQNLQSLIVAALQKIFANCKIIFRNDVEARKFEGLQTLANEEFGIIDDEIIIEENNLKFAIDVKNGQKTGWFFDQRKNREFIGEIAQGSHMLDAFCYQGGFGLNALKNGAKNVTFIDSSKDALEKVKRNLELNNLAQNQEFINEKTFDALEKMISENRQFNVVVLDPPAFVKSKKDLFAGLRGYEKLAKLGVQLLRPNGVMMLASCSHNVLLQDLIEAANNGIRKGLSNKNRAPKLIRSQGAYFDHPLHPNLKESEYLKSIAFVI